MSKTTNLILGLAGVGAIYYFWNKSKKVATPKEVKSVAVPNFLLPKECPPGFEWKKIDCVNEPCPGGCMKIEQGLTEEQKYYAKNPIFVTPDAYVPVLDVPQIIISPQDASRISAFQRGQRLGLNVRPTTIGADGFMNRVK
jgi:hypothetical protein